MCKRSFQFILTLTIGLMFVFGDLFYVFAQERTTEEFTLEEITVTAQKRAENQQKVAISMDVIAADELKSLGKSDIDDILSNISNIMVQRSQDGLRISLRGYSDSSGTNFGQSTSAPAVAVNMDGVFSSRKDTGTALYDLERVEVLFGPQSTMYASNSPGGIVNVVTASPKLDTYEGSGVLEYGNYNLLHTEGMVNAPINSIMSVRTAFQTETRDGYISNGGDDEDTKSGRLKILLKPSENFSFNVTGELIKRSNHMSGSTVDAFVNQSDRSDPWTTSESLGGPNTDTTKNISGRLEWDFGIGSLALVPSYSTHNGARDQKMTMGTEVSQTITATEGNEKSVELRMASSADFFFKWIVGVNYYKSEDFMTSLDYDTSGNVKTGLDYYTQTMVEIGRDSGVYETVKAVYINVTYPITDRFRGTGGIRYSWDDYTLNQYEVRGHSYGTYEAITSKNVMKYNKPDYKVGIEYDMGESSMVYADYSTSYRVQSIAGGMPGVTTGKGANLSEAYPPEQLKAYTVGAKNRFLNNKLQVNASAFYYDYKNFAAGDMVIGYFGPLTDGQLDPANFDPTATQPDPNGSSWGDGKWYGLDLQSSAAISGADTVKFSLSYLHSEWADLTFDYYYPYKVSGFMLPGTPIAIDDLSPATTVTYNGKPMTMSPELTVDLSYKHQFYFSSGASMEAGIDAKYKSAYRLSWKESDYTYNYQEAFVNGDLSGTYSNADGKWSLSAYVKNIRNYAEKKSMGQSQMRIGAPRTFGAVFNVKF